MIFKQISTTARRKAGRKAKGVYAAKRLLKRLERVMDRPARKGGHGHD